MLNLLIVRRVHVGAEGLGSRVATLLKANFIVSVFLNITTRDLIYECCNLECCNYRNWVNRCNG